MQSLAAMEFAHQLVQAATRPLGGATELIALAVVTATLAGLAAYAGWLLSEGEGRETAASAVLSRLRWWRGHSEDSWDARLDRLEHLLMGDEVKQLQGP